MAGGLKKVISNISCLEDEINSIKGMETIQSIIPKETSILKKDTI